MHAYNSFIDHPSTFNSLARISVTPNSIMLLIVMPNPPCTAHNVRQISL